MISSIANETVSNAIISLNLVCLMCTYMISISCVLYQRIHDPELVLHAEWTLGPWGVLVNIVGLAYSAFQFFWSFWPTTSSPSIEDFNWAIVMFLTIMSLATLYWWLEARVSFRGPGDSLELSRRYEERTGLLS